MSGSRLGKGLFALIPEGSEDFSEKNVVELPVEEICLNPLQPRKYIDEEAIESLSESIKTHGLLQPVIVTKRDGLYHLVVGERRLRAVKKLGYQKIPAIIKEYTWKDMLKIALVENLQREDLNPMEEARAFRMLMDEYDLTQEQVAESIGRSRSYVANMVRLLNLPAEVIKDIEEGKITFGHAKALLGLDDANLIIFMAKRIKEKSLSVRQTEEEVKRIKEGKAQRKKKAELPPHYREIQERLRLKISPKLTIKRNRGGKGKIEIPFSSEEDLSRIVSILGGDEEAYFSD